MGENIKLKNLYAEEQTYNDIGALKIPKADGNGNAIFVVPSTSMYMLKESSYSGTSENSIYAYSGVESGITGFGNNVQKDLYPNALPIPAVNNYTFGDNNIYCHPLESMTITELMNRMLRVFSDDNVTVTPDTYSVTPGWFHIKYTKTGEGSNIQVTITEFEKVADPSTVTFPAYLPWTINDANYFYSYIAEATQQVKAVTVTENGIQTINPDAGKSGLAAVALNVNVPSSGGNLQEKEVSITSNGTTEVTPDAGYDGMSKLTAMVNVAGGVDAKSWVFTNGVASISQADFNKYLAPGVIAAIFINVPLEPVGGTGYSQMPNVERSKSSEGDAQLIFAGEEYSLDETSDPKILTPTVGGFGIISRASADADFVLSYVNAYGNTITPAFTSNGVQVTLYAQLLQL